MRRILGVSIESGTLSAALVEAQFRRAKSVKSEDVALPAGEEKAAFIVETFRRWKKEYAPDGVVVGLPLKKFSHQMIEMPAMKRPDMKRALQFELEKYLPMAVDEYLFDFIALPREKGKVNVLVFAVKRELIAEIAGYAAEAEIHLLSIRPSTVISLCGFLEVAGEKKISGLFVNITESACEIAGLKDSTPVYLKGFRKDVDLAAEIERLSVLYPGKIYFMGNVEPSVSGKVSGRKFQLPVANGLALSEVKKACYPLSLLPPELVKQKTGYYPYVVGGLAAACLLLFLLTGVVNYYRNWSTLRSIEAKLTALRTKESVMLDTRRKLGYVEGDRKVLSDFLARSNVPIRVLKDLSDVLPKDAWLVNFSVDDKGKVEIEGFTVTTADLVGAFEKSKTFKNISFAAPIITKDKDQRFALKMEVEGY